MNKGSIISHRCGIGAVACALVLGCAACTEEEVNGRQEQAEKMSFEVGISEEWRAPREGKDAETPRSKGGAFRFEDSDLWVVFSSEAGIDSTLFEQPAPDTRAAAVDEKDFYDSFCVDALFIRQGVRGKRARQVLKAIFPMLRQAKTQTANGLRRAGISGLGRGVTSSFMRMRLWE